LRTLERGARGFLLGVLLAAIAAAAAAADLSSSVEAVERIRGHRFLRPVVVRTIERDSIPSFLRAQLASSTEGSLDDYVAALRALQLIDDSSKAVDQLMQLYESQVLAVYDTTSHVYYALAHPPGPGGPLLEQAVEIHELTHALQDQLFGAGERMLAVRANWDRQLAYQSVLEGEATLVMFAWLSSRTGTDLSEMLSDDRLVRELTAALAAGQKALPTVPAYFVESLGFPYIEGVHYVARAYRRGGWKAVDAIDADPPTTTAEIMGLTDAVLPPAGPRARGGGQPGAAGNEVLDTPLGAFHWKFLLGDSIVNGFGCSSMPPAGLRPRCRPSGRPRRPPVVSNRRTATFWPGEAFALSACGSIAWSDVRIAATEFQPWLSGDSLCQPPCSRAS
jgi:hypothetical protein